MSNSLPTASNFLIYGANGYTGELIAREAVARGLRPTIAGRGAARIEALGRELGLPIQVFGLDDPQALVKYIAGHSLVLNCAGPFSATAEPMMRACLSAGVHYLDITGEIEVFERAQSLGGHAKAKGVVLCPGVGFDVIPTDCVAAALKAALPDATHLALGFATGSGLSPGTAKTSVEGLAKGGKVRRNGVITTVPLAYKTRSIDFGAGPRSAMTIPWGDVSTAFHSTGIPNIEVFISAPPKLISATRKANWVRPLLGLGLVQSFLKSRIAKSVRGPDETAREKLTTLVWGEVTNARGDVRTARIQTANGYALTVTGSLAMVAHVLEHKPEGGAYTPSKLAGAGLIERLPGSGTLHIY